MVYLRKCINIQSSKIYNTEQRTSYILITENFMICRFSVLRFWCNILHINDCAVFVVIVKCRFAFTVFFTSDQRNWPNARAFDELHSHLVTVGRIDQMRSAFSQTRAHLAKRARNLAKRCALGQMPHVWPNGQTRCAFGQMRAQFGQMLGIWSNAARLTNWSNALRI